MIAILLFMFLLLVFAKGYGITKSNIADKKFLVVMVCAFLLAYITLFIWQNVGIDPASTLYPLESINILIKWFLNIK